MGFRHESGFTLIELLIVVAVVAVLAALAVPALLGARVAANEASAIGALRAIGSAQTSYSASAASGGYSATLAALAAPCPGSTQAFLAPDLARDPSLKSGYLVALQASSVASPGGNDCNGTTTVTDFYTTAVPVSSASGVRAFASSARATIYFDPSGVAPTEAAIAGGSALPVQ